jgi:hypothetical protein
MAGLNQQIRDALATAAGQYSAVTDDQRNEWYRLVKEYDRRVEKKKNKKK